jgi:hypothetical protein
MEETMPAGDNTAYDAIARELQPGERILWCGMPVQGMRLRAGDIFWIPLCLVLAGAVVSSFNDTARDASSQYNGVIAGSSMALICIYVLMDRFIMDSYARSRTYYGVTDQRALIIRGAFSRKLRSVSLPDLNDIVLTEKADGSGDVVFGPTSGVEIFWRINGDDDALAPMFEGIKNVRQIYYIIRKVQYDH